MNEQALPRLLLGATRSGDGKTTVTCALLAALCAAGHRPTAFKCGPDYIDPMFHRAVLGVEGCNLDLFFTPEQTVRQLLAGYGAQGSVAVLEGVMGYYDGVGGFSDRASAHHLALATGTPALLVVDAKGASRSLLALISGFARFAKESGLRGIILNRCAPGMYRPLADAIQKECALKVYGYLPADPAFSLESRHLGLVTAAEVTDLQKKLRRMGEVAQNTVDLPGLLQLAATAPALGVPPTFPGRGRGPEQTFVKQGDGAASAGGGRVKLAVAQDAAFCFYYRENLDLLRAAGAELCFFSPLADTALPAGAAGLYLGGGYPELYTRALSENAPMRRAVAAAVAGGMPTFAECGGFLYLLDTLAGPDGVPRPMCGVVAGNGKNTGRLGRFGYVTLTAQTDTLLLKQGEQAPAHEFHYYDCEDPGDSLLAEKATGRSWRCTVAQGNLFAGFAHLYFPARPELAQRLIYAARGFCQKQGEMIHDR